MGYTKEAIKGVSWLSGIRIVTRALSFGKTIIIGKILSPAQFGVFGIATLVLALIEILTETGINIFLVQQNEDIDNYISTSWLVSILRGVIISSCIFLSAPFIASFFHAPSAYPLLLLMSVVPLLRGFINPSIIKLQKDLTFHKEFYYRSTLFLIETLVGLGLIFIYPSPIVLIVAMIVSTTIECVWSFFIVSPRPQLIFEPVLFKKVLHQGKWITFSTILNYFYQHGDDIAVGRMLGTSSLGLYDMAYRISLVPLSDITEVVMRATLPVYVRISGDMQRLRLAFLKTLGAIVIFVFPVCFILFFFPKEILGLIDEKWIPAAGALRVLALFGAIRAITIFTTNLFLSVKEQKIVTLVSFVGLLGLGVTIVPFVQQWGIVGAGMSALVGTCATVPVLLYFVHRLLYQSK